MNSKKLKIKELVPDDLPIIRNMEDEFISINPNNHYTKEEDDDFWSDYLFGNGGLVLGIKNNDKLIGFSACFILENWPTNEIIDGFKKHNVTLSPKHTAWMETTLVLPEGRGNAFQLKSRVKSIEMLSKRGINQFATTVSTDNIPSHKNITRAGFKVIGKDNFSWSKDVKKMYYKEI